jgi:ribosomal protein S18 acetylase RimI-like enzyme
MIADSGQLKRQALPIPKLGIRCVDLGDVDAIAQIITRSFEFDRGITGFFAPLFKYGIGEDLRHRIDANTESCQQGNSPHHACLVAVYPIDGTSTVVGTVEISLRKKIEKSLRTEYLYISNLAVQQDFRRQGVGLELLQQCESVAQSWGYVDLYLHVMLDNDGGRNLYAKAGYEKIGEDRPWSIFFWNRPRRLFLHKQTNPKG